MYALSLMLATAIAGFFQQPRFASGLRAPRCVAARPSSSAAEPLQVLLRGFERAIQPTLAALTIVVASGANALAQERAPAWLYAHSHFGEAQTVLKSVSRPTRAGGLLRRPRRLECDAESDRCSAPLLDSVRPPLIPPLGRATASNPQVDRSRARGLARQGPCGRRRRVHRETVPARRTPASDPNRAGTSGRAWPMAGRGRFASAPACPSRAESDESSAEAALNGYWAR